MDTSLPARRLISAMSEIPNALPEYGEPSGIKLPYLTPWALKIVRHFSKGCVWSAPTREKVVALTFDDGPSTQAMEELLEALGRHQLKATFFVLGDRIGDASPDERRRTAALLQVVRDGHEIALHGLTHHSLKGLSLELIRREIQEQRKLLGTLLGPDAADSIRFLRPPFGRTDKNVLTALSAENLIAVNASILPGDAFFPSGWAELPDRTVARILRELHPGAIICLHVGENLGLDDKVFNMRHAGQIVNRLAPRLKEYGYRAATLKELLADTVPHFQSRADHP